METKTPGISLDILVIRDKKILLGLLTKKWAVRGSQVYGMPGRGILFGEKIGDCVKRNIREEIDCTVTNYAIYCVNANYEWGNHFINIGVVVDIEGDIKLLQPDDWEKWEWFEMHKLPKNLLTSTKNTINCYLTKQMCISE